MPPISSAHGHTKYDPSNLRQKVKQAEIHVQEDCVNLLGTHYHFNDNIFRKLERTSFNYVRKG